MAYDEGLAERVREELAGEPGFDEKRMFGGLAMMLDGNLAVGVLGDDLMVRVGVERYDAALVRPHVRPFDMTGRPMKGWVLVESAALEDDGAFREWVQAGMETARSLPPK